MPVVFASISPHPPIILPSVGSLEDRAQVKDTISALEKSEKRIKEKNPEKIIISAPHPDWGFGVPLHFLNKRLRFKIQNYQNPADIAIEESGDFEVHPFLTTFDSPEQHFEWGREAYLKIQNLKLKIALIASGDLSHCLKKEGPYGFHPEGPKFDRTLIDALEKKDIETILKLDDLYPNASECGLRSFCFMLGILEEAGINWRAEILSYEGPFGVGYLVADFKF